MRAFLHWEKGVFLAVLGVSLLSFVPMASADVTGCRACMTRCHTTNPSYEAARCYTECGSATGRACEGVTSADASVGFGSAASGSGRRSSRVRTPPASTEGTPPAAGAGGTTPNCVDVAVTARRLTADEARSIVGRSGRESSEWSCQRTCTEAQAGACIRGGCPGTRDWAVLCCAPAGGIAIGERCGARGAQSPTSTGGTTPGSPSSGDGSTGEPAAADGGSSGDEGSSGGGVGRLALPGCIESGNCQVSDLVQTGLNLVRFLFGLAGALLLVVFVYAGIEYLLADVVAGFSVKTAKERLSKAVTGIAVMFFGYTLVKFIVGLLTR